VQIVDTLKRRVDLHYRSGYDPNSIKDSQIEKISYKGPNGENNEIRYTYDPQRNVLTRVDYPAGEPIEYRYADVDQHLEDKGVADRGFLLTQVKHPSGFTSEYRYSWFQPNSDELSVSVPDGENKRWSYYRVVQKTHSDKDKGEVEPRVTRYEYSSGQPYQLYSNDPSSVSRRWYFKEHRIIDPLEQATRKVYYMGMLEYMFYPANIYVYNEYDMESRLLKLKRTVQSTSMHDVEYEYDGYGQMTRVIDHGYQAEKNNKDQRVTIMRYDNFGFYSNASAHALRYSIFFLVT
jgi:YD repeat-containing protein